MELNLLKTSSGCGQLTWLMTGAIVVSIPKGILTMSFLFGDSFLICFIKWRFFILLVLWLNLFSLRIRDASEDFVAFLFTIAYCNFVTGCVLELIFDVCFCASILSVCSCWIDFKLRQEMVGRCWSEFFFLLMRDDL